MYFTVSVKIRVDNGNGKIKKSTERYLINALSVTEAEANAVKFLDGLGTSDFEVSAVSQSRIIAVIDGV